MRYNSGSFGTVAGIVMFLSRKLYAMCKALIRFRKAQANTQISKSTSRVTAQVSAGLELSDSRRNEVRKKYWRDILEFYIAL